MNPGEYNVAFSPDLKVPLNEVTHKRLVLAGIELDTATIEIKGFHNQNNVLKSDDSASFKTVPIMIPVQNS